MAVRGGGSAGMDSLVHGFHPQPRVSPAAIQNWIRRGGSLIRIPFDQNSYIESFFQDFARA